MKIKRKESILTTIDPQDEYEEDAVSDAITTENTATQLTTTATPSRAGSWLKPRVDYHPSSASKNAIKFNTIDSSQTVSNCYEKKHHIRAESEQVKLVVFAQ